VKQAFHAGNRSRLVSGQIFAVQVARSKDLGGAGNQASDDTQLQKGASVRDIASLQKVEARPPRT